VILAGCSRGSASPECAVGKTGIAAAPIKGDSMDEQVIALAFDGAPTAYTAEVAELLANKRLGATFFVVGRQVEGREAVLSAVRGGGHLIGNATYSGNKLTAAALPAGELRKADEVLTPYVVGNMFLLRAPDDAFDDDLAAYLNQQGLQKYVGPIGSDVVTEAGEAIDAVCWREALSAGQCAVRYVEALADKKKGIARFTDGSSQLLGLLQELLPALESAGFKVVRLDQVPEIRRQLQERGAKVDQIAGETACNDYGD
jgi:peptidoglycan/xylan/chitin deacetylase (PgdA/CDA1 family)